MISKPSAEQIERMHRESREAIARVDAMRPYAPTEPEAVETAVRFEPRCVEDRVAKWKRWHDEQDARHAAEREQRRRDEQRERERRETGTQATHDEAFETAVRARIGSIEDRLGALFEASVPRDAFNMKVASKLAALQADNVRLETELAKLQTEVRELRAANRKATISVLDLPPSNAMRVTQ